MDAWTEDERILRQLLWANHGYDGLYGDDGEMQCNRCRIDFVRSSAIRISAQFTEIELRKIKEQMSDEGEAGNG